MNAHNKEVIWVIRSPQGTITDVFDPKTNQYLKVVDTAITIESSDSSEGGDQNRNLSENDRRSS